jgi:hypothetical protein
MAKPNVPAPAAASRAVFYLPGCLRRTPNPSKLRQILEGCIFVCKHFSQVLVMIVSTCLPKEFLKPLVLCRSGAGLDRMSGSATRRVDSALASNEAESRQMVCGPSALIGRLHQHPNHCHNAADVVSDFEEFQAVLSRAR